MDDSIKELNKVKKCLETKENKIKSLEEENINIKKNYDKKEKEIKSLKLCIKKKRLILKII